MRAYSAWVLGLFSSTTAALVGAGCSGDNCASNCGLPDAADASVADAAPDVVVPQNCDLKADVATSPACIDDGIGVFVDATSGSDGNAGSKASPFKTIGKALAAVGAKPRVYVCDGVYPEDVSLTQATAVSIYGGLACGSWSYDGGQPTVGKSALALHVDGVTKPIVISDITLQPTNGVDPSQSSVAAFVNSSADVTLRRVKLRPGMGKGGSDGTAGTNWSTIAQTDATIAGNNASGGSGGGDHACNLCVDSVNSTGGGGGTATLLSASGGNDGKPNLSGTSPTDGKGGAAGCMAGDNGPNASPGTAAPGATEVGKLTSNGWAPASGSNGPNGGAGQGGGGGGSTAGVSAGGGGGGGCGGCGGGGGKGGSGGGGSVGLVSVLSNVTLSSCDIVTVAGGTGGAGASGQDGQLGGYAGTAVSPGCGGGVGGQGGKGGAGGGGAGGVSVGILYTDTKPVTNQTNIVVPSSGGTKGSGGAPGINDGIDGVAQATFLASST